MLTVYEPASETLWAADILSDTEIPSVIHDLTAYERTLERAGQLAIRTLVPGHGTQTHDRDQIGRRLREDRDYLAMLRTNVESAVERGLPLGETVSACMPSPLLRGADDETTHRLNVEKVYVDLGGDAEPTKVGFARAWLAATGR
jgi:hypothetical protein